MTQRNLLPLVVALLVLLFTGLVHGLWTGRWHTDTDLLAAAASVHEVPLTIGDWQGRAEAADEESFQQAGAAGYWIRRYQRDREVMTVILMCGRAGRLSVHTPRDCYGGAGFEMVGTPTRQVVQDSDSGENGEFWTARFRKPEAGGGGQLRIYWGWKSTGSWQAPDQSRWAFRGKAFLYKLYLIREATEDSAGLDADRSFLLQMLPTLKKYLFSPPAS